MHYHSVTRTLMSAAESGYAPSGVSRITGTCREQNFHFLHWFAFRARDRAARCCGRASNQTQTTTGRCARTGCSPTASSATRGPYPGQQLVRRAGRWLQRRQLREQQLRGTRRVHLPARQRLRQQLFRDAVQLQRTSGRLYNRSVLGLPPSVWKLWVGIEGDASYKKGESSLSQSSSTPLVIYSGSGSSAFSSSFLRSDQFSGSVKQGWDYSIRGRLGTLITPWSLLYRDGWRRVWRNQRTFAYTGSLALTSSSSALHLSPSVRQRTAVSWSDTRIGGTVGAGWETEIAPGWKARAEYRYTHFGTYTKTFTLSTACSSGAAPSNSVSIDLKESFTPSASVWRSIFRDLVRRLINASSSASPRQPSTVACDTGGDEARQSRNLKRDLRTARSALDWVSSVNHRRCKSFDPVMTNSVIAVLR